MSGEAHAKVTGAQAAQQLLSATQKRCAADRPTGVSRHVQDCERLRWICAPPQHILRQCLPGLRTCAQYFVRTHSPSRFGFRCLYWSDTKTTCSTRGRGHMSISGASFSSTELDISPSDC